MNIIGIDAGGTKTSAAVIAPDKKILFSYKTGSGNVSVNFTEAKTHILEAIHACLESPHGKSCKAVVIGIAGIGSGDIKRVLQEELSRIYSIPILVLNDAELSYYSLFGNHEGVLAIAGTGTVFIGRKNGTFRTVGGWGHLLGDEGSAYDIAIKALKLLAMEFEQGELTSGFSKHIAEKFQFNHPNRLKEFVYTNDKSKISTLSSYVYELAIMGEKTSISLFEEAGKILARQTSRLIKLLQLNGQVHVGCKGSLLENNKFLRKSFAVELQKLHDIRLIIDGPDAVIGAVTAWVEQEEGR